MNFSSFQVHQLNFSANLVILCIIGAVIAYGMLLGHAKVRNLALSTYVGIVLASEFGNSLHNYLVKNHHSVDIGIVRLILFAAPIILLEFSRRHHAKGGHTGMILGTILSALTAGLIIGMGLEQLSAHMLKQVTDSSIIAFEMYTYRLWLVALVPVFIIAEAFIGQADHRKH